MKKQIIYFILINTFLLTALNSFSDNAFSIKSPFLVKTIILTNEGESSLGSLLIKSMDEGKLVVEVKDESSSQVSEAIVYIFSLDGHEELGPFTVIEGETLVVNIDDREWSVRILEKTPESEVTWQVN